MPLGKYGADVPAGIHGRKSVPPRITWISILLVGIETQQQVFWNTCQYRRILFAYANIDGFVMPRRTCCHIQNSHCSIVDAISCKSVLSIAEATAAYVTTSWNPPKPHAPFVKILRELDHLSNWQAFAAKQETFLGPPRSGVVNYPKTV